MPDHQGIVTTNGDAPNRKVAVDAGAARLSMV
jgi:hypothetical protein